MRMATVGEVDRRLRHGDLLGMEPPRPGRLVDVLELVGADREAEEGEARAVSEGDRTGGFRPHRPAERRRGREARRDGRSREDRPRLRAAWGDGVGGSERQRLQRRSAEPESASPSPTPAPTSAPARRRRSGPAARPARSPFRTRRPLHRQGDRADGAVPHLERRRHHRTGTDGTPRSRRCRGARPVKSYRPSAFVRPRWHDCRPYRSEGPDLDLRGRRPGRRAR